jgi:hypothetical protein
MQVELDAFSGRPNPRWELTDADGDELRRLEGRLERSGAEPPEPPGLGYRGFLYGEAGRNTRAYKGYIVAPDGVLADPQRRIERFLLTRLPDDLAGLRPRIAAELESPR